MSPTYKQPIEINPQDFFGQKSPILRFSMFAIENGYIVITKHKKVYVKDIEEARVVLYKITEAFMSKEK